MLIKINTFIEGLMMALCLFYITNTKTLEATVYGAF